MLTQSYTWSALKHTTKALEPPSSDYYYYIGHCMINFYFLPPMPEQPNSIHHVYKLMYWRTKSKKSHSMPLKTSRYDWKHELHCITYSALHTCYWGKEMVPKTLTLGKQLLVPASGNHFITEHYTTHQLNGSFSVLWGTSEHSTHHIVF